MPRHQFTTVPLPLWTFLSSIGPLDFLPAKESLYEWSEPPFPFLSNISQIYSTRHLFLERDNLYFMQFRVSMMAAFKWYSGKWPFCPCRIPLAIQLVLVKDRRDNVMKILLLRRAQWGRNTCSEIYIYKDAYKLVYSATNPKLTFIMHKRFISQFVWENSLWKP